MGIERFKARIKTANGWKWVKVLTSLGCLNQEHKEAPVPESILSLFREEADRIYKKDEQLFKQLSKKLKLEHPEETIKKELTNQMGWGWNDRLFGNYDLHWHRPAYEYGMKLAEENVEDCPDISEVFLYGSCSALREYNTRLFQHWITDFPISLENSYITKDLYKAEYVAGTKDGYTAVNI